MVSFKFKKKNKTRMLMFGKTSIGFTLVETLVAISVLLVIIVGPLVMVQNNITATYYAKDQVIAYYLGQESIEYIRNIRDQNRLKGNSWLSGLNLCKSPNFCGIDPTAPSNQIVDCATNNNCLLNFNQTGSVYGYRTGTGWSNSIFTRRITITKSDGTPLAGGESEVTIKSSLSFKTENLPVKTFEITENITDW